MKTSLSRRAIALAAGLSLSATAAAATTIIVFGCESENGGRCSCYEEETGKVYECYVAPQPE